MVDRALFALKCTIRMNTLKDTRRRIQSFLKKNWFILFAIITYAFFTFYYMGPSVTSCTTTVYGFGDNTAGPIWLATVPKNQGLLGSYTDMTNAPFGDNLNSAIGVSLIAQTILIRATQAVGGPICGYNIANMLGFMSGALVMFGFIYAVTRKRWIALLAGYAVAFVPYFQMKIGNHFAFGFQAIFIGLIWLFYRVVMYRKKRDAIFLGLLFALSIYFDPYYSLLAAIVMGPLYIAWLIVYRQVFKKKFWTQNTKKHSEIKKQLSLLVLSIGIFIVLALPLVAVFATQGSKINADVASSRGNVLAEAKACSNWPHEYVVPFVLNPIFKRIDGVDRYIATENSLRDNFSCGLAEDSVGLSISLVGVGALGLLAMSWEKLNRRRLKLSQYLGFEPRIFMYGLLLVGFVAVAVAFPPLKVHNIIPTPSYELLHITATWRTLTRIFVIVNIVMVIIVSVVLTYFYEHFNLKRYRKVTIVLFLVLCVAVFVEYQAFRPFSGNYLSTFNYTKDVPSQYTWLKNQGDIKTIAEYPLERSGGEGNSMAYYLTMQVIHGKKLFNGSISYSPQETMKTGLKNLFDPQTVPVLKGFGVDAIVVHGVPTSELQKIPYVKVLYTAPQVKFNLIGSSPLVKNDIVTVLGLQNVPARHDLVSLGTGFVRNATIINSAIDWQYEAIQDSVLNVQTLKGDSPTTISNVCFDIKMSDPGESDTVQMKVDGRPGVAVHVNGTYKAVALSVKDSVVLHDNSGHNMRVTKIGCE